MSIEHQLLAILYDRRDGFVSAAELLRLLRIDAAELERAIAALRDAGQDMEASPIDGYRLLRPVRLSSHLIERNLGTARLGRNVICFEQVDSTNDVAMVSARQIGSDGLAVLAESQRAGRGRLGRAWVSPSGANILMSVLLSDQPQPPQEALSIAAAVAVAEAIEQACSLPCQLKWPNDVLLEGRKVCGILVERRAIGKSPVSVVGIGVNVNACPPEGSIDRPATCLASCVGWPLERIEIVRSILVSLDRWIAQAQLGQVQPLQQAWTSRCGMIHQRLSILCQGVRHVGRVIEIDPLEGLLLCRDDGTMVHLPASQSTVE